jgi:hypothetical protein
MNAPGFTGRRQANPLAVRRRSERSMGADPSFRDRDTPPRDDVCFVLVPFLPELTRPYEAAVKPVVQELGL